MVAKHATYISPKGISAQYQDICSFSRAIPYGETCTESSQWSPSLSQNNCGSHGNFPSQVEFSIGCCEIESQSSIHDLRPDTEGVSLFGLSLRSNSALRCSNIVDLTKSCTLFLSLSFWDQHFPLSSRSFPRYS
jgi:hypothetical protein